METVALDDRESGIVRRAVLIAAALLVAAVVLNQLGLLRPQLASNGGSTGEFDTATGVATVRLEVQNRGVLSESVERLEVGYPGVTVTEARLAPDPLAPFASGELVVTFAVECDALTADGETAWSEEALSHSESTTRITTSRPWGDATSTLSSDLTQWHLLGSGVDMCSDR